jgi:alpha-L-rhamnosidase
MRTTVVVPPNCTARVLLEGVDETVMSGVYSYETDWEEDLSWPPVAIQGAQGQEVASHFVE